MRYLSVIRHPYVTRLLLGTLLGRLPAGMTVAAVALALRHAGAPYSLVGLTTAAYAVAAAVGGPALGRMVDRYGQPWVLVLSAVAAGAGYALLGTAPGTPAAALAGAAVAGLAMPPLEPCLRALWPDVVREEELHTAYTLDSASQQLLYVAGPLLVAGIAAAWGAVVALRLAAGLGLAGALSVATAAPSRAWRSPRAAAGQPAGSWLGPLRSPALVVLLAAFTGTGWAVGAQNVLFVAYAEARPGTPGGAGALLALAAGAGLLGALGYGSLRWAAGTATRTAVLAAGMALCYLPLALLPGPSVMPVLAAVSGLCLAPLLAATFALIAELAPAGTVTEAFAWLVTLFAAGNALGSASSGALVAAYPRAAALTAFGGIAAGAAVLTAARPRLAAASALHRQPPRAGDGPARIAGPRLPEESGPAAGPQPARRSQGPGHAAGRGDLREPPTADRQG